MKPGVFEERAMLGAENAVENQLTVQDEILDVHTEDLKDIRVQLVQVTDAGSVVLAIQYTLDGTYWITHTTVAETDFAAAAGDVELVKLANGSTVPMSIPARRVRVVASTLSGGGVYLARVSGLKGASA